MVLAVVADHHHVEGDHADDPVGAPSPPRL
jgi:hypothetical protein